MDRLIPPVVGVPASLSPSIPQMVGVPASLYHLSKRWVSQHLCSKRWVSQHLRLHNSTKNKMLIGQEMGEGPNAVDAERGGCPNKIWMQKEVGVLTK